MRPLDALTLHASPRRFDSSCNVCSGASRWLPAHSTGVKRLPAVLCSHLVHALYPSDVLEKRLPLSLSVRGGLRVQVLEGFGVQGSDLLPLSLSALGGFGVRGSGFRVAMLRLPSSFQVCSGWDVCWPRVYLEESVREHQIRHDSESR